jgi:hypothetical protein
VQLNDATAERLEIQQLHIPVLVVLLVQHEVESLTLQSRYNIEDRLVDEPVSKKVLSIPRRAHPRS